MAPYVNRLAMMSMRGMWENGRLPNVTRWFGGIALAGQFHLLMEPLVPLAVLLHTVGALCQHFWLKSGVLIRMVVPEAGAD